MALYINGNKTGGGGGGNSNIVDTSTPSQSVGNENDLYFKTGSIAGYYHYIVSTVSTSPTDAIIQVQEISVTGLLIKTTTLHHETSGSWTVFDDHFRICYDSPFWKIEILDNNIDGYESGDIISWHYTEEEEYDLKIPVLDNSVTNQYIKIDNDWVEFNNSNMRELTQAEYDALTTEEKNNGTVYYITDGDDNNGGYQLIQPIIYSEEEREVGVWTDGKPLYQKTIDCGVAPAQGEIKSIAHNITSIDTVISLTGYAKRVSDGFTMFLPNISRGNVNAQTSLTINDTNININNGSSSDLNANYNVYLTVQYTKTTDVAGSGKWTPQGTPAVHYSTEEQVVGTWVDGNTIYEKTIVVNSTILIGQDNIINHNISDFGRCVSITGTCTYNQQNEYLPLPYSSSNMQTYGIILGNVTNTRFQITPASGFTSIENIVVTIQYTKTTT